MTAADQRLASAGARNLMSSAAPLPLQGELGEEARNRYLEAIRRSESSIDGLVVHRPCDSNQSGMRHRGRPR